MRWYRWAIGLLLVLPQLALAQSEPLETLSENGVALYNEGKYLEAEPILKEAVDRGRRELGPKSVELQRLLYTLGILYVSQSRYDAAEPLLKQAVAIGEDAGGPMRPETVRSLSYLAELYRLTDRGDKAESLLHRALELGERDLGADHSILAVPFSVLGLLRDGEHHCDEARALHERAIRVTVRDPEVSRVDRGKRYVAMSYHIYACWSVYPDARAQIEEQLAKAETYLPSEYPSLIVPTLRLGWIYTYTQRFDDAERYLLRAKSIAEKAFAPTASVHKTVCRVLRESYGDRADFEDSFGRASKGDQYRQKIDELGCGPPPRPKLDQLDGVPSCSPRC